ncbi:hypothetical protein N7448_000090 [Penicillium atrosanguineum]|uniref:uncharacterized protein n=1 Tax=Penicillium atrosanguineum TaxID=1132637 RepID=UPI00238AB93C|nr:uncharacterized protein N7443_003491 [Penicillium atrosanguineum]KAJ5134889.1 hypothetical protein N7526_006254 [Penicillium atrosanguineum]KAJ5148512.1 hypothetical protein N7448_000090 [Penicillium atrosanguineum]KAJ5303831.1 hypothetical protein N7443_003491 [Penicillium atrosanguineum]
MSIDVLPTELLTKITGWFEQPEWFALRLASRALYSKSLDAFADYYYKTVCLLVTSESIQKLRDIATNDDIRARVKELLITPVLFDGRYHMSYPVFATSEFGNLGRTRRAARTLPPPRYAWTHVELEARYAAYQAIAADHEKLLQSDVLGETLRSCMVRFENIRCIGLRPYSTAYLLDSDNGVQARGLGSLHDHLVCEYKSPLKYHRTHLSIVLRTDSNSSPPDSPLVCVPAPVGPGRRP